ncbi:MAG: hypothetical protein EBU07_09700 [Betaproteobacteria bacterium]|nr:hypothetical protein [Betaproteobacteria bacterium]NBS47615.1 hypothetical protein [Betaproteobacteria bacterium]
MTTVYNLGNKPQYQSFSGDDIAVSGGNANDMLEIYGSNSSLNGDNGNDWLAVYGNNDSVDGGRGDDMLYVVGDYNTATGGRGADTFVFGPYYYDLFGEHNTITDFKTGVDRIDVGLAATPQNMLILDGSGFSSMDAAINAAGSYWNFEIGLVAFYNVAGSGNGVLVADSDLYGGTEGAVRLTGVDSATKIAITDVVHG